ncbi:unnamed protein product [Didymodactylos carnosus]|uniref:Innexin n=1 Tax=Didymodactylos carnosus TaxID=1234261 RepID=A0A814LU45_9BILA|nr:unnamed protein product [Didymodactylos carnosus]CAF3837290.1 unnamed protein product [Didymodactylos carnosus]
MPNDSCCRDPFNGKVLRHKRGTIRKTLSVVPSQICNGNCILLINIFYEKVYFFLWIWFSTLFLISIINFIYTIYNNLTIFGRNSYVKKMLRLAVAKEQHLAPSIELQDENENTMDDTNLISNLYSNSKRLTHFVHWLQPDGVFLLHLLNHHVNELVVISSLSELAVIWTKTYENKANLAQNLLRNNFSFQ